uniref:Uncharacterized protein n=1 Tax=Oncorhynchus tshawytscha TaxID=74940 RepID=A0AAZ3QUQ8_ONCTS
MSLLLRRVLFVGSYPNTIRACSSTTEGVEKERIGREGGRKDNDPKHTSRLCKGYLTKKESAGVLHQMTWPPQSSNLKPIEMVWDELDHRAKEKHPTSAQHMWELLQDTFFDHHMCYFIVLMSSLLFYNVENSKK